MKFKGKYKFPCGMEYEVEASGFFMEFEHNAEDIRCPLHGKDCNKK